jgi:hypothetical protein
MTDGMRRNLTSKLRARKQSKREKKKETETNPCVPSRPSPPDRLRRSLLFPSSSLSLRPVSTAMVREEREDAEWGTDIWSL